MKKTALLIFALYANVVYTKAHFCREAGHESQALMYDKLAKEKGIDHY